MTKSQEKRRELRDRLLGLARERYEKMSDAALASKLASVGSRSHREIIRAVRAERMSFKLGMDLEEKDAGPVIKIFSSRWGS